ncbi:IBR domain-containing protein [Coprinopsis cinerea AmutBmut pab1-1]|nr:IBR domain-containing protein [Coprinopsis cinerea AmutBmut pab1-1]
MELDLEVTPPLSPTSIAESKRQQRESIWQSADIDTKEILRQLVLSNPWPELVAYDGPSCSCNASPHESNAGEGGQPSCALISMFCARTILDLEKQVRAREYRRESRSLEDEASGLLDDILAERTVQRIVSIGQHLKGALRMGPSELLDVPLFEQVFLSSNRIERFTSYENILSVLDQLCKDNARRIASTVITQFSQSVVCVKLSLPSLDQDLFIVFDPHRRSDRPNGPSFMLSTSRITTATFLNCLLDSPAPHDVTGLDNPPTHHAADYFMAHLLSAKDSYHRISTFQNEQMLRESFLCTHEEALSSSIDYVNLWNHLLTPDVGPSSTGRASYSGSSPVSTSSSSNSSSNSETPNTHPLPPLPLSPPSRGPRVSEPWQSLLDQMKLISQSPSSDIGIKVSFECAVCFDTFSITSGIQLSGCDHRFCKECLRGHVQSFLDNGRYPIECPVCLLDRGISDPGNVTYFVLDRLHLPRECSDKFQELQILQHSVKIECPKCFNSNWVSRKDYLLAKTLNCPLSDCLNKWCKFCSKALSGSKGKHSCKGDGFEKLMKKKGWRYCPGCTMPVLKDSGCNHMACVAPGCHTHFCYKCGKHIVTSATGRNVGEEVTLHYNNGCRQFERKWKCTIQ